jgi:hypothetical protein
MSVSELIKSSGVAMVLYINSHVMLLGMAYSAGSYNPFPNTYLAKPKLTTPWLSVLPVFWFTDPKLGGLGFTPFQISLFLGMIGISQALWLLLIFPPLQRSIGTGGVLRGCATAWPVMLCFAPLCNVFLRWHWDTVFWVVAPTVIAIGSGVSMAFSELPLVLLDFPT